MTKLVPPKNETEGKTHMTLEYADPRFKMRVGRTYFFGANYKKYSTLKTVHDEDNFVESYERILDDNPTFEDE